MRLRGWFPTCRRILIGRALARQAFSSHASVLVVGSGHDPYASLFPRAVRYVRTDIRPVVGRTDVVADGMCLPFRDGLFSCVVATECLEHVPRPQDLLTEMIRVARPGGTLFLTVPFLFHQHGDPDDYWRPTPAALRSMLASCHRVEVISLGHRLHVISDLLTTGSAVSRLLLPMRLANHLLARMPGSIQAVGRSSTAPTGYLVRAVTMG